jgi:CO/xanthine dehydrogenase Mo-binding subunit
LTEDLLVRGGVPQNPDLLDYKMPTSCDVPHLELVLVEVHSEEGVYGARGVGEPPIIPTAPAIANAVYDAVGVRINDLPLTPEKVLRALEHDRKRNLKS